MPNFKVVAPFQPAGDQPAAIAALTEGIRTTTSTDRPYQTLLGVTGSGKTMTMAQIIAETGMPALVLAHNKTLAAQLCNEMKEFFPENSVEYFISYYDYYQPESYIPSTDTFIEKEASINDEIDRLRHSTTRSLWERKDVIVVGSVSVIYGLGVPERYLAAALELKKGQEYDRTDVLRKLVSIHYGRNDVVVERTKFRARGEILEVFPSYEDRVVRCEFFGDEIERISIVNPVTGEIEELLDEVKIYPAKHYVADEDEIETAIAVITMELEERLGELIGQGKLVEAQRLKQRTQYDLEMLKEVGYCNGIENYSRVMEGRAPGSPPKTLIDYFVRKYGRDGFITFIDESHVTVPSIEGHVSRRPGPQRHSDRLRLQIALRPRQPPLDAGRIFRTGWPYSLRQRHSRRLGARSLGQYRRADNQTDRTRRPCRRSPAHQRADRRPYWRNQRQGFAQRAHTRDDPDQAHGRRFDRVSLRARHQGQMAALGYQSPGAHRAFARSCVLEPSTSWSASIY